MFQTLLAKEFREQWRTWKMVVFLVVFLITGIISPVLAKYTPELLKSIPNLPAGLADFIPAPSVADSVAQYLKNTEQFGILLVILLTMGVVAQEKERGTAAMLLTHPLPRLSFLLAKFIALGILFTLSLAVAAVGCWYYTYLLFEALPWGAFLALNGLMLVVFLVYIAVTLLCSTLVRTQGAVAWLAFAALVLVAGIGSLPRIGEYFPGQLFSWGGALVLGGGDPAWPAFWIALGMIVAALGAAWLVFRRQEL